MEGAGELLSGRIDDGMVPRGRRRIADSLIYGWNGGSTSGLVLCCDVLRECGKERV